MLEKGETQLKKEKCRTRCKKKRLKLNVLIMGKW